MERKRISGGKNPVFIKVLWECMGSVGSSFRNIELGIQLSQDLGYKSLKRTWSN